MIRLWGEDLPKFYKLIRQSAIDEQLRRTLDKQLEAVAKKLEAMADKAGGESGGPAANFGDAFARELMGGIARQPHLLSPLRGVLQGPLEPAGSGNTVLMKRAAYAKRIAVSVRKLADLIKQGLPTAGKGRMVRVKVTEADRWVRENLDHAEAPEEEIAHDARARARATNSGRR